MEEFSVISLKSSRIALCLQMGALLLALAALCLSGLSWILKLWLSLLLLLIGGYEIRKQRVAVITSMGYGQQQGWMMVGEKKIAMDLYGEQLVLPWLVVIQWKEKESGKKGALALWADSAHKEDLRRLRVFLRVGAAN